MKGLHSRGKTIKVGKREGNQGPCGVSKRSKEKLMEENQKLLLKDIYEEDLLKCGAKATIMQTKNDKLRVRRTCVFRSQTYTVLFVHP
jgi:hypothetical protein